jgi:hypothetical protein
MPPSKLQRTPMCSVASATRDVRGSRGVEVVGDRTGRTAGVFDADLMRLIPEVEAYAKVPLGSAWTGSSGS